MTAVFSFSDLAFLGSLQPPIITAGLVLHLDAGNPASYPGSGTTWADLSGNGNNGMLVNGVGYSVDNLGSLRFDGVNDYLATPTIALNTNTGFTTELWIYIEDPQPVYNNFWSYWYSADNFELGTYASSSSQGRFIFKDNGAPGAPSITSPYIGDQWANVVFGCNATTPFLYTNGVFTGTAGSFRNTNIIITSLLRNNAGSTYYKASQSTISFYNRALTPQEIQQNFNALCGRFGI